MPPPCRKTLRRGNARNEASIQRCCTNRVSKKTASASGNIASDWSAFTNFKLTAFPQRVESWAVCPYRSPTTAMQGQGEKSLAALAAFRELFKKHLPSKTDHGCVSRTGAPVNVTGGGLAWRLLGRREVVAELPAWAGPVGRKC
jgi:hypothetical protein